jgi:hypothetical protein
MNAQPKVTTPNPTPSALFLAHQESSAEKEATVSPAIAKDTAVQVPPRGDQRGREKREKATRTKSPGTKDGTTQHSARRLGRARSRAGQPLARGAIGSPGTGSRTSYSGDVIASASAQPSLGRDQ